MEEESVNVLGIGSGLKLWGRVKREFERKVLEKKWQE